MQTNHAALAALLLLPSSIHGFSFSTPSVNLVALRSNHRGADFAPHEVITTSTSALYSSLSDETEDKSIDKAMQQQSEDDLIASFEQPSSSKILTKPIPYEQLTIGVMKEVFDGENRVSITPDNVEMFVKAGFEVVVQSGAGENASFSDAAYLDKGATILLGEQFFDSADIITKIRPPSKEEVPKLAGKTLIGMISPSINTELYESLTAQNTNVLALDCVPRMLSRAQSYDVLSSQANIAGYRSMVEASNHYGRFLAGQMTAAGKVPPAKVLVLGAGVAGLAAIQTAKNMGAIVRAFDVRPVTKEQVESMGATFLEVPIKEDGSGSGGYAKEMSDEFKKAQNQMMLDQAKEVDIIITTALIPGRKAPILVDQEMLDSMKPGSVCVDLAAANGGNVAQTQPNEVVTTKNGVKVIGYTDLPSRLPNTASTLVSLHCFWYRLNPPWYNIKLTLNDTIVWKQCCQIYHKHRSPDHQRKGAISD